jgi:hypothetical protein
MTQDEWLACDDPSGMLAFLEGKITKRKCLLFACACERRLWEQPDCEREKVEASERYADGEGPADDVLAALEAIGIDGVTLESVTEMDPVDWAEDCAQDSADFAANAARKEAMSDEDEYEDEGAWDVAFQAERVAQAALLRDVVGDPFRTPSVARAWLTPDVTSLAETAYTERSSSSGELDPQRLAVLADALEEAGCTDADVLAHLRSPGPHVRGCWAVDLILGKE